MAAAKGRAAPARPGRLITREEVAARYGIKLRTVDDWVRSGRLPPWVHLGNNVKRMPERLLDELDARLIAEALARRGEREGA